MAMWDVEKYLALSLGKEILKLKKKRVWSFVEKNKFFIKIENT